MCDSFNINTCANPDGWGNKLVTFFARHRDNFIMTINFLFICQIRDFRLWINPATGTTLSFAGTGKKCAMVACPPGLIRPKVPGHLTADGATNVYSRNHRAVRRQSLCFAPACLRLRILSWQLYFVCFLKFLHFLSNFILTDNFHSLCGIHPPETIFSYLDKSLPRAGILKTPNA